MASENGCRSGFPTPFRPPWQAVGVHEGLEDGRELVPSFRMTALRTHRVTLHCKPVPLRKALQAFFESPSPL